MTRDNCDLLCLDLATAEGIREKLRSEDLIARVQSRAKAVGDGTRLRLLIALSMADELCGCDLAWISGRRENLVAHHLRVLRETGLIDSRREGKMVMHSLTEQARLLLDTIIAAEPVAT